MQQLRVTYHGQVQGVGFRWTVKALADPLQLEGFVMNQADGTVLVLVRGARDRIARLMEGIDTKYAGYITEREMEETCDLNPYQSFEIRR